jgi:hypothetical protein
MNDQDLAQAKTSVESILNALGVARVVYVDDANDESVSVEDVIAAALGLDATLLLAAFPELGDSIPDDQAVLTVKIREVWGRLDPAVQPERGKLRCQMTDHLTGEMKRVISTCSAASCVLPAPEAQRTMYMR